MEFKHNNKRGLGYNAAHPSYNYNYFGFPVTKEEEEKKKKMVYGKHPLNETVGIGLVQPIDTVHVGVNDTNASTSCAAKAQIEDCDSKDDEREESNAYEKK